MVFFVFAVKVQLEIDEKVLVTQVRVLEQAHLRLLFLVNLHVAVVTHNALVQATRRQSICSDKVKHVFVLELANCCLFVAQDVRLPRFVEKELFDTEDSSLRVNLVILEALVAEADQLTCSHEEHALVHSACPDDSLTSFEFNGA